MIRLNSATPKARKQHECDLCYGTIEPGEVYDRDTYIGDDGPYTWKSCVPCREVASGLVRDGCYDPYDGYTPDDADEWAHEAARAGDPVAVAFLARREVAYARARARRLEAPTTTREDHHPDE